MKQAFIYSLKVWLTALVLVTLLDDLVRPFASPVGLYPVSDLPEVLLSELLRIPVMSILYLPILLILWLVTGVTNRINILLVYKKIIWSLVAIPLPVLPFALLNPDVLSADRRWSIIPYFICWAVLLITSIWLYKFKTDKSSSDD